MKPKCYIAGAMESTGRRDLNFPLFDHVAAKARADGYDAFSPVDLSRDLYGPAEPLAALPHEERKEMRKRLLARELSWICVQAEIVYLLPGWQDSPGAQAERMTALAVGVDVEEVPVEWLEDFVDTYSE
jgi:hypothetical protein